jgi:hypothetical protein
MTPSPPEADEHPDRGTDEQRGQPSKATVPAGDALPPAWDEDANGSGLYASPPCFMHELDPAYLGLQPSPDAGPADAPEGAGAEADDEGAGGATMPGQPDAT